MGLKGLKPMFYAILFSDGHFSNTIGRLPYWSALGSFHWSVRLPPVAHCPPQLLQLVRNSSSVCRWSRSCVVFWCRFQSFGHIAVKCDRVLCLVQLLFLQKMTDFKEQCICIKLLVQIGKIGAETFQMLTLAFREEAVRQTVVFDCSAEFRNGMTSVKDAEY